MRRAVTTRISPTRSARFAYYGSMLNHGTLLLVRIVSSRRHAWRTPVRLRDTARCLIPVRWYIVGALSLTGSRHKFGTLTLTGTRRGIGTLTKIGSHSWYRHAWHARNNCHVRRAVVPRITLGSPARSTHTGRFATSGTLSTTGQILTSGTLSFHGSVYIAFPHALWSRVASHIRPAILRADHSLFTARSERTDRLLLPARSRPSGRFEHRHAVALRNAQHHRRAVS
jgi:hypothetical protein